MAGSFSDFWENEIIDHVFNTGAYTAPTHMYVGLSTADPLDTGLGNAEPSGGSYARVDVTTSGAWDAASSGATANTNAITFPTATGSWGTCSHFAVWSASSGGDLFFHGSLSESKAVGSGDTPKFNAGDIDVSLA